MKSTTSLFLHSLAAITLFAGADATAEDEPIKLQPMPWLPQEGETGLYAGSRFLKAHTLIERAAKGPERYRFKHNFRFAQFEYAFEGTVATDAKGAIKKDEKGKITSAELLITLASQKAGEKPQTCRFVLMPDGMAILGPKPIAQHVRQFVALACWQLMTEGDDTFGLVDPVLSKEDQQKAAAKILYRKDMAPGDFVVGDLSDFISGITKAMLKLKEKKGGLMTFEVAADWPGRDADWPDSFFYNTTNAQGVSAKGTLTFNAETLQPERIQFERVQRDKGEAVSVTTAELERVK